ncbi:PaaI family thioesterase [Chryseobacterium viscerum]|uniref:PaaI family thioesterase n=1 Tax=Chryseobacterium viscerum TaxID=1037377 RepID=UPI002222A90B|nr:PaaI family thioesterase [Chryseobacterium viscerum]MCW1962623.1 PaaI family thioesterase [Chryseobacterium viscerum]
MYDRIQQSFNRQGIMKTIGAQLEEVQQGQVKITCRFSENFTQHNGFFHAGVLTTIVDSACGYAALTTMPENANVLTVEFKVNFMKPANTDQLVAIGKVLQAGKTLTICEGYVYDQKEEKLIAKMTATMIAIQS